MARVVAPKGALRLRTYFVEPRSYVKGARKDVIHAAGWVRSVLRRSSRVPSL